MITVGSSSSTYNYSALSLTNSLRQGGASTTAGNTASQSSTASNGQLTAAQQSQVDELKAIDRKVRAHEQAHLSVGGDLVRGGASFIYEKGPDGKQYAVAGEVSIDTSEGRTPEETIPKAQHIRETALAPVDPSAQDRQVAAYASNMEQQARMEVASAQTKAQTTEAQSSSEARASQVAAAYNAMAKLGLVSASAGSAINAFA